MGNYSSIVQNYNIRGDGNVFRPTADQRSSAVPTLQLRPGILNPGGLAWRLLEGQTDPTAPGALVQVTTLDYPTLNVCNANNKTGLLPVSGQFIKNVKEEVIVIEQSAICEFQKLQNAIELNRDYLSEQGILPQSANFSDYVVYIDCYVGLSAEQASRNFLRSVPTTTRSRTTAYITIVQAALAQLNKWESALREVMTILPTSTSFGELECDMKSVVAYVDAVLPDDNLCRLYPEQAAAAIAMRTGAVRWKDTTTGDTPLQASNSITSVTQSVIGNAVPLGEKSDASIESLALVAKSNPDLVCSDRPTMGSVWSMLVPSKDYNIRAIPVLEAMWLRTTGDKVGFDISWEEKAFNNTYHIAIRTGMKALFLDEISSCVLSVDFKDKNYTTPQFNPSGKVVSLLVLSSKLPLEQITKPDDIMGIVEVSNVTLRAAPSSTQGASVIATTSLTYVFEREVLPIDKSVHSYLLCMFRSNEPTNATNYPWFDAWDANTTISMLTAGEVTLNGVVTDTIVPTSLIGAYTPEVLASALPNDAGEIMTARAQILAEAIKREDDTMVDEASPFSAPILGQLALQTKTIGVGSIRGWDPPRWLKQASRALQMFLGNPKSILSVTTPVLKDPNVWVGLAQGVYDAISTKSMSAGWRKAADRLNAAQSVRQWKQKVLGKIQKGFPPST
ncbi:major outer capsid protein [Broome reovirus]|uniref:Major outer capsid protein n=1 Tax=Broome reovirus TaxID=667093 RepID=D6MM24_9REOV|nr:major outer capsid protein [Broome reovirus]ACU68604.1 major outer capsid protein [Broome reovirus]